MSATQGSKRRRTDTRRLASDDEGGHNDNSGPSNRSPQARVRHARPQDDDESDDSDHSQAELDPDVVMDGSFAEGSDDQLVKKLVRYALACEYARMTIKRDGIRDKVLGNNSRAFKRVFDGAQQQLRQIFGMEMMELPAKEKRTLKDKQKAAARKGATQGGTALSSSTRQYILVSTLPDKYKTHSIIGATKAPSAHDEATYVAFYTLVISVIVISGGELSDMKLKRYLQRLNAGQNLPIDSTDNVLQRMVRQGYVDKTVERSGDGDDLITWAIGPRGKVEVPPQSIAAFVTQVWGELPDDFDKKLQRSLRVSGEVEGGASH